MPTDDVQEELEYLEETLEDYERFIKQIGTNGLSANLLLYHRDDIQEILQSLEGEVDLRPHWIKVARLDSQLRDRAALFVEEVGRKNLQQCRIVLDPPKLHWWWYLDQTLPKPVKKGLFEGVKEWLNR
ncbi:MAG: hypothetical protein HYU64_13790 [Armatimonadetes bacterium]|nr:hypothetical protein [Armatimonadota bacterium]